MNADAYYLGTFQRPGHMLWQGAPMQRTSYHGPFPFPWRKLDGTLNPWREIEGECFLHHCAGWTALAFANRTDDSRPGSNSVFIVSGTWDFDQAVAKFREAFPRIVERFAFELVELVRVP